MSATYVGVCPYGKNKFRAQIARAGHIFYLGIFDSALQCAQAYDRASFMTEAWAKRSISANFSRPDEKLEPVSDEEKEMMITLRASNPEMEDRYLDAAQVTNGIPDALLGRYDELARRIAGTIDSFRAVQVDLRAAFVSHQTRLLQAEKELAWYKAQNIDLEAKLAALQALPKDTAGKPIMMRRIFPAGAAPAPEIAAATP